MTKQEEKAIHWKIVYKRLMKLFSLLKWPATLIIVALILDTGNLDKVKFHNLDYQLILSYIDVLIWPLVALTTVFFIKPHLPILAQNLRKLGGAGMSAEFGPPTQKDGGENLKEQEDSDKPAVNPETGVDTTIHDQLTTPEAKLAYNQIYQTIYGTQLSLLKRLQNHIPDGLTAEELQDIYEAHKSSTDLHYPTFISFVQYLIDTILLLYEPESKRYKLTNAGYYFLKYLSDNDLYESYKPY